MDPEILPALRALAEPTRLWLLGRLAAAPASLDELASELALPMAVVVRQIAHLRRVGLVGPAGSESGGGPMALQLELLQRIGRELDERERRPSDPDLPAGDARVLRGYLEAGRLTTIPAHQQKRLVVLRWLREQVFTETRDYPEREVNQRLALFHPDVASLRRYLADAGLVRRERGIYRRAG